MRIDDVVRGAAEDLTTNAARDVDPDTMFRSLQRTRSRRRISTSAVVAFAVLCLSFGGWTVATDALNPQSAPVLPAGQPSSPQVLPSGFVAIPAGTYRVVVAGSRRARPTPVVRVPAGYSGGGFAVNALSGHAAGVAPDTVGLAFWRVQGVFTNPCAAGKYALDPGPSVADLARALATQPLRSGTDPVPVSVAGYKGLYVETSVPAHIDFTKCEYGYFDSWTSNNGGGPPRSGHCSCRYQQGPGQQDRLWILNVNGYRLVIDGWNMPGATQRQIHQITQMVKTLTFQANS